MNVGIFTDTYYPQINGVVTSTCMLKAELEKLGHRVYVFTTTDPNAKEKLPRVFRLPSMPFVFLPSHRVAYMYSPKLMMNLKKLNLDIVHTQTEFPIGIFGKVVSELFGIPNIHTYHTMYEDYVHYVANGHLITPAMAKVFSRVFCNRAKAVIAPVEKTRQSLLQYGVAKPIEIIPTGLNFSAFRREQFTDEERAKARLDAGLNMTDPVIVYVGRIAKEKSLEVVLHAMPEILEKMPDVKLVLVGDGPLKEEFESLAKKLKIEGSVLFPGSKPWAEIGKYYQIGDVFTTASTSETQGLTYLEAMAGGVPVVAKKDPSVENIIVHSETGYFFEENGELSGILHHVLTHKEEASRVADRAYESIQTLSAEQFGRNVENLYNRVIERYKRKKRTFPLRLKKIGKDVK